MLTALIVRVEKSLHLAYLVWEIVSTTFENKQYKSLCDLWDLVLSHQFFADGGLLEIVQSPLIYTSVRENQNHAHGNAKMESIGGKQNISLFV